jgi:hypothetical protein
MMILERKIGDLTLWEFVIAMVIINLLVGILLNFISKP